MKACLITNPKAGRGHLDLSRALLVLRAQGWEVTVRRKLHGGMATDLARQAAQDGYDVVVACAGDGTVREIVHGLAGTEVAVGVLPGGTANVWAHELGVSPRLEVAAMQLLGAERRRVDVGHVQVNGHHGRHFLLMAGLGLDGAVIARVSKPLKNRLGVAAVGLAAVRSIPAFQAIPVQVEMDSIIWEGRVSQVVVGNTRRYGGFTRITPDALIDDGLLDVCLFTTTDLAGAGRQLVSLLARGRPNPGSAEIYRVARLTITAPSVLPLQLDGGAERLKKVKPTAAGVEYAFEVQPRALTVLVPRAYNGELFSTRAAELALDVGDAHHPSHPGKKHRQLRAI